MYSVPAPFLEVFYKNYQSHIGTDQETFALNLAQKDKKAVEELADSMFNERYAGFMSREEYDSRLALDVWREEQPNAAQIVGHRMADRATKLAGGAAEAVDSAIDWLGIAFQPTPTAGQSQHAGGQPVRSAEQRDDVELSTEERKQFADNMRRSFAASSPVAGALERGAPKAGKALREHESKFEHEQYTTWEELGQSPLKNFVPYAIEEGLVSLPDMVAAVASLPAYAAARAGEIGGERAENDLRDEATVEDFFLALPAAALSASLERIGALKVFGMGEDLAKPVAEEGLGQAAKRVGGAWGRRAGIEGLTESLQEPIEQVGASAGTGQWRNKSTGDIGKQLLSGAFQGGVTGFLAGGAISAGPTAYEEYINQKRGEIDQEIEQATPQDEPSSPDVRAQSSAEQSPGASPPGPMEQWFNQSGSEFAMPPQQPGPQQPGPAQPGPADETQQSAPPTASGAAIQAMDPADRTVTGLQKEAEITQGQVMRYEPDMLKDGMQVDIDNGMNEVFRGTLRQEDNGFMVVGEDGTDVGFVRTTGDLSGNPLVYSVPEQGPSPEMEQNAEEMGRLLRNWDTNQDQESLDAIKKLRNSREFGSYPEETRDIIDTVIREGNKFVKEREKQERDAEEKAKAQAKEEEQRIKDEEQQVQTEQQEMESAIDEKDAEVSGKAKSVEDLVDQIERLMRFRDSSGIGNPGDMEWDEVNEDIRALLQANEAGDMIPDDVYQELIDHVTNDAPGLRKWGKFVEDVKGGGLKAALLDQAAEEGFDTDALSDRVTVIDGSIKPNEPATEPEPAPEPAPEPVAEPEPEPAVEPEESKPEDDPIERLANDVEAYIRADTAMDNPRFFANADLAFGGTVGEGAYDPQQAYNAMEYGMNRFAASIDMRSMDVAKAEMAAVSLDEKGKLLPTQTRRTDTKIGFQQFSTPPGYAMAVNWVAGVAEGDRVLEPSAGAGGLAVMARAMGGDVTVNELQEDRLTILNKLFGEGKVWKEDANHLPMIKRGEKFDVVVMNPPFSKEGGRGNKRQANVAANHVRAAAKMLNPGGRMVIITGPGFDLTKASQVSSEMKKNGRIRAVVRMDGNKIYRKYGTTFDNHVTVWDKHPENGQLEQSPIVTGEFDNLSDFIREMDSVRKLRQEATPNAEPSTQDPTTERPVAEDGSGEAVPQSQREPVPGDGSTLDPANAPVATGQGPVPSGEQGPREDTGGGGQTDASPRVGSVRPRSDGSGVGSGAKSPGSPDREGEPSAPARLAVEQQRGERVVEIGEEDRFAEYQPTVGKIKGAAPHPAKLVESAAMASVSYPPTSYRPYLPEETITEGGVSGAQLEKVVLAGQAHSQMINDGVTRRGFLDGDGTGTGKGRSIAAMIYDNFRQGRKKAIWVSEKPTLMAKAGEDFDGVGFKDVQMHGALKKADWKKMPELGDGVLFTTYDQLKQAIKEDEGKNYSRQVNEAEFPRVQQIAEWLGQDFDGAIVFDEAHNMKKSAVIKTERGKTDPSQNALAGTSLARYYPGSRVYYATATAATDVVNFAYLERLGLWGEGTQFDNMEVFLNDITSGGTAAMELVSRDIKQLGLFASRSISFDGVSYDRVTHSVDGAQKEMYDTAARAWQAVLKDIYAAIEGTMEGAKQKDIKKAKNQVNSTFWGANQRFYKLMLTSMQMPTVIKNMEEDIANGLAPVIQLENTNDAALQREISRVKSEEGSLEDVDITPKSVLSQMINNAFPTAVMQEVEDPSTGRTKWVQSRDSEGNLVEDPDLVAKRDALLEQVASLQLPGNPIDMILNHFGHDNVAEITGRQSRIRPGESGKPVIETGLRRKAEAEIAAFNNGDRLALIFSRAGGTGADYHAGLQFKNQKRRAHYIIDVGWEADKAVQGSGRTNRSNQKWPPIYKLFQTDIPSNKRFVSAIARRLDKLGALTKGQRDTSTGMFDDSDNIEDEYGHYAGRMALIELSHTTNQEYQGTGFTGGQILDKMGLDNNTDKLKVEPLSRLLNRMLNLERDIQDQIFEKFIEHRMKLIQAAKDDGTYDTGVEVIKVSDAKIDTRETLSVDEKSGAETQYVKISAKREVPKRVFNTTTGPWVVNKQSGMIYSLRETEGWHEDVKTGRRSKKYARYGVKGGVSYAGKDDLFDAEKYDMIHSQADAAVVWKKQYDEVDPFVDTTVHMITGAVLPVYSKVKEKGDKPTKVKRIIMNDGSSVLGIEKSPSEMRDVMKKFGRDAEMLSIPAGPLMKFIIENGYKAQLDNGDMIERRRVSGETRIELRVSKYRGEVFTLIKPGGTLDQMGFQFETINSKRLVFVPQGAAGEAILGRYLKGKQVSKVIDRDYKDHIDEIKWHRPAINEETLDRDYSESLSETLTEILRRIAPSANLQLVDSLGETFTGAYQAVGGKDLIWVALNSADPRGVLRHEIIHALRNAGMLTAREWKALTRVVDKKGLLKKYKVRERYPEMFNGDSALDAAYEEAIADHFGGYAMGQRAGMSNAEKGLFDRIMRFFRELVDHLRDYGALPHTINSVFDRIESGAVGRRSRNPRRSIVKKAHVEKDNSTHIKFSDPEAENRWRKSSEQLQQGVKEQFDIYKDDAVNMLTRTRKHIPNDRASQEHYAELNEWFLHYETANIANQNRIHEYLEKVVGGMNAKDLDLANRNWVLSDLRWTSKQGMAVPLGLGDYDNVVSELKKVEAAVKRIPGIEERVDTRNEMMRAVTKEMIKEGLWTGKQARNPNYYRHMVIQHAKGNSKYTTGAKIKTPFWHKRRGSEKDIVVNFVQAEADWLIKAYNDIATVKLIKKIRASKYNQVRELRELARAHNKSLEAAKALSDPNFAERLNIVKRNIGLSMSLLRREAKNNQNEILQMLPGHLTKRFVEFISGRGDASRNDDGRGVFEMIRWLTNGELPDSVNEQAGIALATVLKKTSFLRKELGAGFVITSSVDDMLNKMGERLEKQSGRGVPNQTWQPDAADSKRAMRFYTAKTVSEHVQDRAMGMLEKMSGDVLDPASVEILKELMGDTKNVLAVGGPLEQMVLDENIASALTEFHDPAINSMVDHLAIRMTSEWKMWILHNPYSVVKYNINNLSGDAESAVTHVGRPFFKILRGKASKEIWDMMFHNKATPSIQDALDRGVLQTGMTMQEIQRIGPDMREAFGPVGMVDPSKSVGKARKIANSYFNFVMKLTRWRENSFRYAAFLYYKGQFDDKSKGSITEIYDKVGWAATPPEVIRGITDRSDAAARMARDLFVDYANIPEAMKAARRRIMPFGSWVAGNTIRNHNVYRNIAIRARHDGSAAWKKKAAKMTTGTLGYAIPKALWSFWMYANLWMWNNLLMDEQEELLSAEMRNRLHLNLGIWDGTAYSIRISGAVSDYLAWFGLEDSFALISEARSGRADFKDVASTVAKAPVKKLAGAVSPLIKTPLELITGNSFWPDPFEPRPIRDKWRHMGSVFRLEAPVAWAQEAFGIPSPSDDFFESIVTAIVYKQDIGAAAYTKVRGMAYNYHEKVTGSSRTGGYSSPKSNTVYKLRRALQMGDKRSADLAKDELREKHGYKGTWSALLKNSGPLSMLSREQRANFIRTLSARDKSQVRLAENWHRKTSTGVISR